VFPPSVNLFPSLISVVTFNNDPCDTESGVPLQGTCYTDKECKALAGTADGTCANDYGVCCVISGNVTISTSGSYFKGTLNGNVNSTARTIFPFVKPTPPTYLAYQPATALTLNPPAGTTQIRFDFETLTLLGPIEGDCNNDTVTVVGANPGASIPVICGENSGQHMIVDIDNSEGPYNLIISTSEVEFERSWKIKVTFLSSGDASPRRCLQYFTEPSGEFSSFNYVEDSGIAINNQDYAVCFGYVKGYCDVDITFSRFDLGNLDKPCGDDVVSVQGEQICGDVIDYTARANATGPIVFNIQTDDLNELEELGFTGSYMMMPCEE